ncbi:MAG: hypothetical protein MRZ79_00990 [Bacteroidia bacterium]|nr:hypothetical protein [Bacteroidia bacterium]
MKQIFSFVNIVLVLGFFGCQTAPEKTHTNPKVITTQDVKARLNWLIKSEELMGQLEINEAGIALYRSPGAKDSGEVECRIYPDEYVLTLSLMNTLGIDSMMSLYQKKGSGRWEQLISLIAPPTEEISTGDRTGMLSGWKIAVDPGHISNDIITAEIEGKYVKMKPSSKTGGKMVEFFEPHLTLATAYLIKDSLEKLGADVMISRPYPGKSVNGKSFDEWQKEDWPGLQKQYAKEHNWDREAIRYWKKEAPLKDIFKKMFNDEDLKARADKINDFKPDLTLVIHYNIHSPNWDKRDKDGFFKTTEANYCMAFIPGSFAKGELAKVEDRLHFLRLLLSDDLEKSQVLGSAFMEKSLEYTQVPAVPRDFPLPYLEHYSILVEPAGLYARNLSLTRKIWGPMVYGESLCQDNIREANMLNENDKVIGELAYPSRLDAVARAYIGSVLEFVKTYPKNKGEAELALIK